MYIWKNISASLRRKKNDVQALLYSTWKEQYGWFIEERLVLILILVLILVFIEERLQVCLALWNLKESKTIKKIFNWTRFVLEVTNRSLALISQKIRKVIFF